MRIAVLDSNGIQSTVDGQLSNYYIVPDNYNFATNGATDVTSPETLYLFFSVKRMEYFDWKDSANSHVIPNWSGVSAEMKYEYRRHFVMPNSENILDYFTRAEIYEFMQDLVWRPDVISFDPRSLTQTVLIELPDLGTSGKLITTQNLADAQAASGFSGVSGYSGLGLSGYSGISGTSGSSGVSGVSGVSGFSGVSGYSGNIGISGTSGFSGTQGFSGVSGVSGFSGISGFSGYSGVSGFSGTDGTNGSSGFSGYSGVSGTSGRSGFSGYSGASGFSGLSGYSGIFGFSGMSGYSGVSGFSGYSGTSGFSGTNGAAGTSGFSGTSGSSGISGFSGRSGFSGVSGVSGYSGAPLSTAGVGTSPAATQTTTITHGLGKVPAIIRIYGYGTFTANSSATATTSSIGIWNSSGNRCVYQRFGATITATQAGLSSTTFAILLATGGGSYISGVIQNVTSTSFDIAWTETGTTTAQVYMWEAQ
jgi:hypothetical protein